MSAVRKAVWAVFMAIGAMVYFVGEALDDSKMKEGDAWRQKKSAQ